MTFKQVGTRVYAENGALVRSFDTEPYRNDVYVMDELYRRVARAQRFTAALNGTGPRAEHARRSIGV